MPATAAPAHVPAVDQPEHPLPALATFELTAYRRQLEAAIAFSDTQQREPPVQADLQARLDAVLAEQDDRARIARA